MSSHRRDRDYRVSREMKRGRSDSPESRRRYSSSSRRDDLELYQEKQIRPNHDRHDRHDRHESEKRRHSHKDEPRSRSDRHHRDDDKSKSRSRKRSKRETGTPTDDDDLLNIRALGISPITEEDY